MALLRATLLSSYFQVPGWLLAPIECSAFDGGLEFSAVVSLELLLRSTFSILVFSFLGSNLFAACFWTRLAQKLQAVWVYAARVADAVVGGLLLLCDMCWAVSAMT